MNAIDEMIYRQAVFFTGVIISMFYIIFWFWLRCDIDE